VVAAPVLALLNGGASLQSGLMTHVDSAENSVVTVRERRVDRHADNTKTMPNGVLTVHERDNGVQAIARGTNVRAAKTCSGSEGLADGRTGNATGRDEGLGVTMLGLD
jgi:hypothetical protein